MTSLIIYFIKRMNLNSYLYQFLVGGLIFFMGIILAVKSGDYSWKRKEDRRFISILIMGYVAYLIFTLLWYFFVLGKI